MDIYTAVMKAADHIERNPHEFEFTTTRTPGGPGCGTPGCALGWTACFAGVRDYFADGRPVNEVETIAVRLGCKGSGEFYDRMRPLTPNWITDAALCAKAMRLYAAKYLAKPEPRYDFEALARRLATESTMTTAGRENGAHETVFGASRAA